MDASAKTQSEEFLPTRRSLLTRLKNWDDQEGWREFFDTYGRLMFSVARKAGFSPTESQDIVQETVISIARKMQGFRYDPQAGSFKAWLMLVVRSRIADALRRRQRRVQTVALGVDTEGAALTDSPTEPAIDQFERVWEEEWQLHMLQRALECVKERVSARQFQIFDLYVNQGLPLGKITAALGVNAAQVYLAKHRISRLIRKEIQRIEASAI